jgi:hypothetical protein
MTGTVYTAVEPAQTDAGPVIVPAAAGSGFTVTANVEEGPLPHWFVPATVTFPDTADVPKLTVMLVVPAPDTMEAPVGTVHE